MGKHHRDQRARLALSMAAALCVWTTAAAQELDVGSFKDRLLALLNEQRAANGLPALQRAAPLEAAAQSYSETMMRATAGGPVYLSHTGPDGSTLGRRVSDAGYHWASAAEDLAAGQRSPEQVVADWMSSPLHRQNVLSPVYRDIGLGLAVGPGAWTAGWWDPQVLWWTVDFGSSFVTDWNGSAAPSSGPPPTVTGYTALDGTAVGGAAFGSLLLITGQNLGRSGTVTFHGQTTSAVSWSPASIMAFVPLQPSYPDAGPVTVTMGGQSASGPDFTTVQPGAALPPAVTASPGPAPAGAPTITGLVDSAQRRLQSVPRGLLFFIRGRGFGTNASRRGQVTFSTMTGGQLDGAVWGWSDDTISVFAPYFQGAAEVVVQVEVDGSSAASNQWPLAIR